MILSATTVREYAQGRWRTDVFPGLGIDVPADPRRHGPCPACGGKDRFFCDDQDGLGSWFCRQCTPQAGDGFALIQNVRSCNFKEALTLVAGILGLKASARCDRPRPAPKPPRLNRRSLAFQFEICALDLRLRSEKILDAAKHFDGSALTDEELEKALGHVGQAYADQERAELFEHVADTLRIRDFTERISHEQRRRAA
ncbi:MAG: primase-helicase zinc-binding domain-containing protein [Nitrospirales bacterium]